MPNTIFEFKVKARPKQVAAIEEAIRTAQFIRNKCVRLWMDSRGISQYDLSAYCKVLAKEFKFADELNSMARQAAADRAWSSISRFYDKCKKQIPKREREREREREGKSLGSREFIIPIPSPPYPLPVPVPVPLPLGYPKFAKHSRSVEYKTTGWKLSENRKAISFTDKKGIGKLKLIGTYDLNHYQLDQIKRVRLVRRADGYYCQFVVAIEVLVEIEPTKQVIGLDVGLKEFYTDSNGHTEPNPRFYRQGEKKLKRLQRRLSRKYSKARRTKGERQSNNYHKARNRLARQHLKISRQREEHAKRLARCVISSNDVVVYEDLKVRNLVKNHCLAKSIHDAGWYQFRRWLEQFGQKMGKITVAVPPHYTSQECSKCGVVVKKSLSTRTHKCQCGCELDRDLNAAINILKRGLSTAGHAGTWVQDTS